MRIYACAHVPLSLATTGYTFSILLYILRLLHNAPLRCSYSSLTRENASYGGDENQARLRMCTRSHSHARPSSESAVPFRATLLGPIDHAMRGRDGRATQAFVWDDGKKYLSEKISGAKFFSPSFDAGAYFHELKEGSPDQARPSHICAGTGLAQ